MAFQDENQRGKLIFADYPVSLRPDDQFAVEMEMDNL
jgi:hypothetical protein